MRSGDDNDDWEKGASHGQPIGERGMAARDSLPFSELPVSVRFFFFFLFLLLLPFLFFFVFSSYFSSSFLVIFRLLFSLFFLSFFFFLGKLSSSHLPGKLAKSSRMTTMIRSVSRDSKYDARKIFFFLFF